MESDKIQGLLSKFAARSATGTGLGQFVSQNITEANGAGFGLRNNSNCTRSTFNLVFHYQ
ncbi:MAG TPA: hypothetical protein VHG34_03955 [Nitrososphaeraceae archaeon]|nr:hypothetical protein [Nitrososphaera sp.]HEX2231321.1 hypothetical protein [Nitrososphaeraceae archaeon]